jgi:glycosyltransferase involved in cell wall biosynthesis
MNSNPICAIWLVTYNQKNFISQTLESILSQQTEYPFKIFIGDDYSTDGTRDICIQFKKKFPDVIDLVFNDANNMHVNTANTFKACFASNARYIALCEGDDYWVDNSKLQKQISFLEHNLNYSLTCHNVFEWQKGRELILADSSSLNGKDIFEIQDLAKGNFIHTPSVVFRNIFNSALPDWYSNSPVGDYVLYMLCAEVGKIKYFDEPMAVYRKNVGFWSGLPQLTMFSRWIIVLDVLIDNVKIESAKTILKEQKLGIINYLIELSKNRDEELFALKTKPAEIAAKIKYIYLIKALLKKAVNKIGIN